MTFSFFVKNFFVNWVKKTAPLSRSGLGLSSRNHDSRRFRFIIRASIGGVDVHRDLRTMPRDAVENALRRHGAEGKLGQIATLEVFGDRVVKRPQRATLELFVPRVAEFLNRAVNVAGRESLGIHKVDQEIRRTVATNFRFLVKLNPLFHVVPVRNNAGNSIRQHAGEIGHDVRGVATSKLHIRREAKIFADQHPIANADRGGEALVVSVAQTKNDLTIHAVDAHALEGEPAEVALPAASKRMFFKTHAQTSPTDSVPREGNKVEVGNRGERIGAVRSRDGRELIGGNLVFCDDEGHGSSCFGLELVAISGDKEKIA